jgi:hypothetical protein
MWHAASILVGLLNNDTLDGTPGDILMTWGPFSCDACASHQPHPVEDVDYWRWCCVVSGPVGVFTNRLLLCACTYRLPCSLDDLCLILGLLAVVTVLIGVLK